MKIAVIGGGPAGLRAAEIAVEQGASVTVFDAKPSVGRKFLVAGRGGLNLTKDEPLERFVAQYSGHELPTGVWQSLLAEFDQEALRAWAYGLGVETFVATSKRVYPKEMKAAPLLRRWIQRLRDRGVEFAMRHRWQGMARTGASWRFSFAVDGETRTVEADAAVLALGGGSWPETGSDGGWVAALREMEIAVSDLRPANCGWEAAWPENFLRVAEGQPLKNIRARAGEQEAAGELMVTRYGLEGGIIYQLGAVLRELVDPVISLDLKPSHSVNQLVAKLGPVKRNFVAEARQRWRLSDAAAAILDFCQSVRPAASALEIAEACKGCSISLKGPRPLAEAISSAGGVRWGDLDENLMLKRAPGIFVAGEMIDW